MSHLIPEQRADRNGRLVTRHVLAPGTAMAPLKAIPAVPPMTDMTQQIKAFQKLSFLRSSGTQEQLDQLYPVAGTIALAVQACGEDPIRDLYSTAIYDGEENWVTDIATTCHFIAEAGGVKDSEAAHIAVHHAAFAYRSNDLLKSSPKVQQCVVELVSSLKDSAFAEGVVGHGGSQPVDIKRHQFLDYLCSRIKSGTLKDAMPALSEMGKFLDFGSDEQEDDAVVNNLDYIALVELMEYTRSNTNLSPEATLSMVRGSNFKVAEARSIIENYDGASVLIEGAL